MTSLLDEAVTWSEFGRQHLDRRLAKAITTTLGLERPTLVQSRGIPVALEGKDLLCRARTGSGKTLCYSVPLVQRLLADTEGTCGVSTPLRGLILVPTKELVAQVHGVLLALLSFCFDVLSAESLLSGQRYMKAELPTILITTPSSVISLTRERKGAMQPLSETLKLLVVDEADLMFSYGYEEDMRALCALLPPTYQAMLVSATLSEEVERLKGLMLHKPVILKLEEPRAAGKLTQFYLQCRKDDKYLILYTLLKLQLIQGKSLMFVHSVDEAYKMKIFLERFSINSAVLNAELPHASRQNIIDAFNQSLVSLLIATDSGVGSMPDEDYPAHSVDAEDERASEEAEEPLPKKKKKKKPSLKQPIAEDGNVSHGDVAEGEPPRKKKRMLKRKAVRCDDDGPAEVAQPSEVRVQIKPHTKAQEQRKFATRSRRKLDDQYSITRGVDLQGVTTVINADMPATVRDYVHRVGRCARGGASGTALTLVTEPELPKLELIMRSQSSKGGTALQELPMRTSDAERFRYRVSDIKKSIRKKIVAEYRARELQLEALNSDKLKEYFEEHPEDRQALQCVQRSLKNKATTQHLAHLPSYLLPEGFAASTPVQKAVRAEVGTSGAGRVSGRAARRMKQDPLQTSSNVKSKAMRALRFSREAMLAKDARINPEIGNGENLPSLSGRKLWKLRHGKRIRKDDGPFGVRTRLTWGQRKRKGKFANS